MMFRRRTDLPIHLMDVGRLEPLSRADENHEEAAHRCRKVAEAINNLLIQLGEGWCATEFTMWLRAIKEVYEHERLWHAFRLKESDSVSKEG